MISANTIRSNRSIFVPFDTGSPKDGVMAHISALGQIARLDFERHAVAGEVIFAVEGDAAPTGQQDEEARIGSLAYALKKLSNPEDAAEFTRCLNAICDGGDARCRQMTASHYYGEISARGASVVLKEMALLAMQLASLNSVTEEVEDERVFAEQVDSATVRADSNGARALSLFEREVEAIRRLIGGRRKAARLPHDELTEWVNDLEAGGASVEEMDDAFEHLDAMEQYDECGAILTMSSHERTIACGRLDPEFNAEDLPERAQYLAGELRRAYANGARLEEMWDDLNAQIEVLFPVSGKAESGARFYSHANRELQQFTRQILEAILADCEQDFHLTALGASRAYREFHKAIRRTTDTRTVGGLMKRAYEARMSGGLPLKHFTALNTAASLQRERLQSARLSVTAMGLLKEVNTASRSKLRFLSWACYGNNQPNHPIHIIPSQEASRIWDAIRARKEASERQMAA